MSFYLSNRKYDECATKLQEHDEITPYSYYTLKDKYENYNRDFDVTTYDENGKKLKPLFNLKNTSTLPNTQESIGFRVALESNLRGQTRYGSKCPDKQFLSKDLKNLKNLSNQIPNSYVDEYGTDFDEKSFYIYNPYVFERVFVPTNKFYY